MDRLIKNIMERIAEKREDYYLNDDIYDPIAVDALDFACDVIEEEVKEYNNGWIPCSERLPEDTDEYLVTIECGNRVTTLSYDEILCEWFDHECNIHHVIAWQPLPLEYKEGA